MSVDRDKIIDKIKKLLALAGDDANEHECMAAALKAQKLISEYDVEESEIHDSNNEEIFTYNTPKFSRRIWRGYLAQIIADNFRCKSIFINVKEAEDNYKLRHSCRFIGYKHDIHAALLVYDKCVAVGERLAKERFDEYKRIYGSAEGVKNTFLEGFCAGIHSELSKQCYALALTTPQAVNDALAKMNLHTQMFDTSQAVFDDYHEGVRKGKDVIKSSRLEESKSLFLS